MAHGGSTRTTGPELTREEIEAAIAGICADMIDHLPDIFAAAIADYIGMPGDEDIIATIRKWVIEYQSRTSESIARPPMS